jgi:serine/threonine protein kinase
MESRRYIPIPSSTFSHSSNYQIGSYEIFLDHRIGMGGYSVVYLGRCVDETLIDEYDLNKEKYIDDKLYTNIVAVKKILTRDVSSKVKKAIMDEISIAQKIKRNPHDNIVKFYDIIDDIDTIYIIMEYCDSGDLSKIIGKPLKEKTAQYYFRQIINGIKYLNTNHIIHRDIKPKNILLTDNKKTLKICDFGLAKELIGNTTKISTICGSPLYMAPEMFYDKTYDETVDIWSIGIILYEMLFGINPFHKVKDRHELEQLMIKSDDDIHIPKNVSESCFSLLSGLLQKSVITRLSFDKIYDHEWIKSDDINVHESSDEESITCNLKDKRITTGKDNNNETSLLFDFDV